MTVWLMSKTTIPATGTTASDRNTVLTFAWMDETSSGDGIVQANALIGRITNYLAAMSTGASIRYANFLNMPEAVTEVVNMLHARPRLPIVTFDHTSLVVPADAGHHQPPEVSLVVSYGAPRQSGLNPKRRRGRHYFGPLQVVGATQGLDTVTPTAAACQELVDQFQANIMLIAQPTTQPRLAVYSRYNHAGFAVGEHWDHHHPDWAPGKPFPEVPENLPQSFVPATVSYVDQEWDTQRRRGITSQVRFT